MAKELDLEFIDNLKLAERRSSRTLKGVQDLLKGADENKPGAAVDAGSVISFVANVSGQNRSDVLNSTLLAQLAANHKYDRMEAPLNWYGFYTDVLGRVGWVLQEFGFKKYETHEQQFTLDAVLIELFEAILTGNELLVAKATVDALKKLSDDDNRLVVFSHESHSTSMGNFQLGLCSDQGDAVAMKANAFHFTTKTDITRILWAKFTESNMYLYFASNTMTLNKEVYEQVRAAVIKKLGDAAKEFVENLPI